MSTMITEANRMADGLERIAGGALSDYEGVEADEIHILRCAKLIRDLAAAPDPADLQRERFDRWLETISVDSTRWGDGEYTDPTAYLYWQAWKAALTATK